MRRIDELFAIEREINGRPPDRRLAVRRERSKPLIDSFETWLRGECRKLSSKGALAKAINCTFNHWQAFTRFLDDGRICLSNNAAERALRGIAVGRRNWTFCGSDSGGHRAAVVYTLIESAKLSDVDPKAWLADVLARIADSGAADRHPPAVELEGRARARGRQPDHLIPPAHFEPNVQDRPWAFAGCLPIVLVQDNLNTQAAASLYEAFLPEEARRLVERFEWHYTPKHGSWLNMAEAELAMLSGQCPNRRIPDRAALEREVTAWLQRRNANHAKADWRFTTTDARIKLKICT